jgi:acyl carrier protein
MSVRSEILSQFDQVAKEQDKRLVPLADDLPLLESGLDSLCFAIVVVRIGDALGVDPFSESEEAFLPVTVGDFIKFYENAAK